MHILTAITRFVVAFLLATAVALIMSLAPEFDYTLIALIGFLIPYLFYQLMQAIGEIKGRSFNSKVLAGYSIFVALFILYRLFMLVLMPPPQYSSLLVQGNNRMYLVIALLVPLSIMMIADFRHLFWKDRPQITATNVLDGPENWKEGNQ